MRLTAAVFHWNRSKITPVLKTCRPRVMVRSSPGWNEFMRKNRGSFTTALGALKLLTLMCPKIWPGINDRDEGTFAWLSRLTSVVERLKPKRAVFKVRSEITRVADIDTYWLR